MLPRAATAAAAVALTAAALTACDRRRDEPAAALAPGTQPSPATPPSTSAPALRPIAELRERAILVEGTRRIALWLGDAGWYEPDARGLAAQPATGAALARARADLGELADVFLGARPVLAGGEEHRERFLRFAPAPREIPLHGMLLQVAAVATAAGPLDVWRYEHELRTELATIDAAGALAELPGLPRVGPDIEARSPVSAKACAVPKVRDLAATGDALLVLVTECHPRAPVRIATYRWPGPARTIATLGSLAELDLQIDRLLAAPGGTPILVGRRGDTAVVLRPVASPTSGSGSATAQLAEPSPPHGPTGVESITHAAVAADGAVWIRWLGRGDAGRDRVEIARDGAPVPLTSPAGAPLRAESLAVDEQLGIVVLATEGASRWLLAERPPPGPPIVLPGR